VSIVLGFIAGCLGYLVVQAIVKPSETGKVELRTDEDFALAALFVGVGYGEGSESREYYSNLIHGEDTSEESDRDTYSDGERTFTVINGGGGVSEDVVY
jgi:hypothetical protein